MSSKCQTLAWELEIEWLRQDSSSPWYKGVV